VCSIDELKAPLPVAMGAPFEYAYDRARHADAAPPPLARVPLVARGTGAGAGAALSWGTELVKQIHYHGFAIVELPDATAGKVANGLAAARALFAQTGDEKRDLTSTAGTSEGYSAAAGGVHECYEAKRVSSDPDLPLPSAGIARLYDTLDAVARACLAARPAAPSSPFHLNATRHCCGSCG
jgi:hypothetical protein